ncbi:HIRAN domain-containing protein [Ruminococcaceae bacterium YRB3002]|nr:HIRAN domain-containing protein [Ruminococcaceae bacterium YRB3002]
MGTGVNDNMNNSLAASKTGLIVSAGEGGIGELLKPLSREIHLFDTYIAGTSYLKDPSVLDRISAGDRLLLMREDNRFDDNAILVLNEAREKLGYVPEKDNVVFARLMDAGKLLTGKIKKIDKKGTFRLIGIEIYMVDF